MGETQERRKKKKTATEFQEDYIISAKRHERNTKCHSPQVRERENQRQTK